MLDRRPDCDSTYVNAIIASSMLGQPDMASHLLTEAMKAGVSFPRLMSGVKSVAFEVGEPDVYEDFMLRSQRDCPWLERAIDSELLQYYISAVTVAGLSYMPKRCSPACHRLSPTCQILPMDMS